MKNYNILGFKTGYTIFNMILFLSIMPITFIAMVLGLKWILLLLIAALAINAIYIVIHVITFLVKRKKSK